jgi:beta-glucanase (GH16 family)
MNPMMKSNRPEFTASRFSMAVFRPLNANVFSLIAVLAGIVCVSSLVTRQVSAAPPAGYSLVWADEFDGTALDTTKWGYRQLGVRNDATNDTRAVTVGSGVLTITTFTENGTNYTGMIGTQGKFEPLYGYMEASIKFQDSPGEWSAFWMQSPTFGQIIGDPWTSGTEMDIVEHRAHNTSDADISNQAVSNIHWDGYAADHKTIGTPLVGSGLATGFHTFAVEWTPDYQKYSYDGVVIWTVNNSTTSPVSHRSEYFILSSEVHGASWAGTIPANGYGSLTGSTTKMIVDYVRCYQLSSSPPPAPTGLMATAVASTQINLSWTASTGATSYNAKAATVSGGPYATIATGITTTTYSDMTAASGATTYYVVSAVNAGGESANSTQASATTPVSIPPAPTGLTATVPNGKGGRINLAWNTSTGATSYHVKRATVSGGPYTTIATGVTATTYNDSGLTSGTTYYYVVSAANSAGESANSNQASATSR